jgi:hypothetical protein
MTSTLGGSSFAPTVSQLEALDFEFNSAPKSQVEPDPEVRRPVNGTLEVCLLRGEMQASPTALLPLQEEEREQ